MNSAQKLAKRIFKKYKLTLPINLDNLVSKFASIEYVSFPRQASKFDGLTLDLKVSDKNPRVYINQDKPERRQNFTLAHELGHIVIPWHLGNIVDNVSHNQVDDNTEYETYEREADEFASELLLPEEWILDQVEHIHDIKSLDQQISYIYEVSGVSHPAIGFKVTQYLKPNYTFIVTNSNDEIQWLKQSPNTYTRVDKNFHDKFKDTMFKIAVNGYIYYWFDSNIEITKDFDMQDVRRDQDILVETINDLGLDNLNSKKISINSALAHSRQSLQKSNELNYDNLFERCVYKVESEEKYNWITSHKDYKLFIHKRTLSLLSK